jgi:[acyl-carrier-protein] S-malonyltransferase
LAEHTVAFVFPAFANDYSEHPGSRLHGFSDLFQKHLDTARKTAEPELTGFDFETRNFLDDELLTQFVTYIYSCAASDVLQNSGLKPSCTSGYSMGIYAALYHSGSIDFTDGLRLIRMAYQCILKYTTGKSYSMGTLIGLEKKDILRIMDKTGNDLEITNQNSPYAFVISGAEDQVMRALETAREEGALHTRQLNVRTPYHAGFLRDAANDFAKAVLEIPITTPSVPMVSVINATVLKNAEAVREELTNNLFHHLNWYGTLKTILGMGVKNLIECGPSKGLVKNARFVEGDFRFLSLDARLG